MENENLLGWDEGSGTYIIYTKLLSEKISQLTQLKSENKEHQQKIQDLEERLKSFEQKDILRLKQHGELEQSKKESEELVTSLKEKDSEISSLKKQIENLQTVRGIVDKFGTYKSLQKTLAVLVYIREQVEEFGSVRWIEVINNFKSYHWAKSTIEDHLRKLREEDIIVEKRAIKGEYMLNVEKLGEACDDFDNLVRCIIGTKLYGFAKESWMKKQRS